MRTALACILVLALGAPAALATPQDVEFSPTPSPPPTATDTTPELLKDASGNYKKVGDYADDLLANEEWKDRWEVIEIAKDWEDHKNKSVLGQAASKGVKVTGSDKLYLRVQSLGGGGDPPPPGGTDDPDPSPAPIGWIVAAILAVLLGLCWRRCAYWRARASG